MSIFEGFAPEEKERTGAGDYRCEIVAVEEAVSKSSGNPMLVVTVRPNGTSINVKHYMVKNQYFNSNLTSLMSAFDIDRNDFNIMGWVGAVGAAKFGEDENGYLKVKWFLKPEHATHIPPWAGAMPERQTVSEIKPVAADDDEVPFI